MRYIQKIKEEVLVRVAVLYATPIVVVQLYHKNQQLVPWVNADKEYKKTIKYTLLIFAVVFGLMKFL